MNETKKLIAGNLRTVCKLKKVKQKDIAAHMSVTTGAVANWLNGVNGIDIENVVKLCRFLGVTVDQVVGSEPLDNALSKGELHLISIHRVLDEEGRHKLTDYADDLKATGRYDLEKTTPR